MSKTYAVYILTNEQESAFYVGVTSNLTKRVYEHKNKLIKGFATKYNLEKLVYFERVESLESATEREKQLKDWNKALKVSLIKEKNPNFNDLGYNL